MIILILIFLFSYSFISWVFGRQVILWACRAIFFYSILVSLYIRAAASFRAVFIFRPFRNMFFSTPRLILTPWAYVNHPRLSAPRRAHTSPRGDAGQGRHDQKMPPSHLQNNCSSCYTAIPSGRRLVSFLSRRAPQAPRTHVSSSSAPLQDRQKRKPSHCGHSTGWIFFFFA